MYLIIYFHIYLLILISLTTYLYSYLPIYNYIYSIFGRIVLNAVMPSTGFKSHITPRTSEDIVERLKTQKGGPGLGFINDAKLHVDILSLTLLPREFRPYLDH